MTRIPPRRVSKVLCGGAQQWVLLMGWTQIWAAERKARKQNPRRATRRRRGRGHNRRDGTEAPRAARGKHFISGLPFEILTQLEADHTTS